MRERKVRAALHHPVRGHGGIEPARKQAHHAATGIGGQATRAARAAQGELLVLDDGSTVAIKVQRPRARAQIERDLSLMGFGSRLVDRLPGMRYMSIPGAVEKFGAALQQEPDDLQEILVPTDSDAIFGYAAKTGKIVAPPPGRVTEVSRKTP